MKRKSKRVKTIRKPRVLVNSIIDRSGSMDTVWYEHLNGFSVFIDSLRAEKDVDYFVSLTMFDTEVLAPALAVPLAQFNPALMASFPPRGGTALYDAVGITLVNIDKLGQDFDKIVNVIITDGGENSSREWTKEKLHSAIDERLQRGNHTFNYLGTQPETWDDAEKIGLRAGSTVKFGQWKAGDMYFTMGNALNNFAKDTSVRSSHCMTATYASEALLKSAEMELKVDPTV